MLQSFTDKEIIVGLLSRDMSVCNRIAAFLYNQNHKIINQYVINNHGSIEDAEDLFQEIIVVFINQVWEEKFQLKEDTKISTYIYAIAKKNWLKKIEREGKKLNWEFQFAINQAEIVDESPIDMLIEDEELRSSWYIFDKLGNICKAILTAYYRDKKTMEEIAVELGFPNVQVVKTRKFRCMQELGNLLEQR